eukprot:Pgem_evm1s502
MVAAIDIKNHVSIRLGGKFGGWCAIFTTGWHKYFSGLLGKISVSFNLAYTYFNTTREKQQNLMKHWEFREKLAM